MLTSSRNSRCEFYVKANLSASVKTAVVEFAVGLLDIEFSIIILPVELFGSTASNVYNSINCVSVTVKQYSNFITYNYEVSTVQYDGKINL